MKALGKLFVVLGLLCLFIDLFLGGFLMFIGLVMFLVGKDTKQKAETAKRQSQERPCPFCKEPILKSAIKCKHCQSDVPAEAEEVPMNETILTENGLWECKNCHTKMLLAGDYCTKCRGHKKEVAIKVL